MMVELFEIKLKQRILGDDRHITKTKSHNQILLPKENQKSATN